MLPVGFTKAIFFLCCCILSGIGVVVFLTSEPSSAVLVRFVDGFLFLPLSSVVSTGLLHVFVKMTFYFGGYDHSVLYTTAQLTEGRSARDQPKQPPAKKSAYDLQTSSCRLSYVPNTVLVPTMLLDAADHLLLHIVSWHSLLYHQICLQISALLSLDCPHETLLSFTEGVGNGVTSLWHTVRLVLLSSSTSSLLMYFCTPPHGSSTSNPFFILFYPSSPSYSLIPHDLTYPM